MNGNEIALSVVLVVVTTLLGMTIVLFASALITVSSKTRHEAIVFWVSAYLITGTILLAGAVIFLALGHLAPAVLNGGPAGYAYYLAWDMWRKKPPRRKVPRVVGVVRQIRGRLGIVNVWDSVSRADAYFEGWSRVFSFGLSTAQDRVLASDDPLKLAIAQIGEASREWLHRPPGQGDHPPLDEQGEAPHPQAGAA